jgi:hypothetical protein
LQNHNIGLVQDLPLTAGELGLVRREILSPFGHEQSQNLLSTFFTSEHFKMFSVKVD